MIIDYHGNPPQLKDFESAIFRDRRLRLPLVFVALFLSALVLAVLTVALQLQSSWLDHWLAVWVPAWLLLAWEMHAVTLLLVGLPRRRRDLDATTQDQMSSLRPYYDHEFLVRSYVNKVVSQGRLLRGVEYHGLMAAVQQKKKNHAQAFGGSRRR